MKVFVDTGFLKPRYYVYLTTTFFKMVRIYPDYHFFQIDPSLYGMNVVDEGAIILDEVS